VKIDTMAFYRFRTRLRCHMQFGFHLTNWIWYDIWSWRFRGI